MNALQKFVGPFVVLLLIVTAGFALLGKDDSKTLTASFPRTISVYEGSEVRVLGIPVGKVDTVTPSGTDVVVTMTYDKDINLPADAKAVIIAPSLVGDRYIQLTPAYTSGQIMADGAKLSQDDVAVPLELDQVYSGIDDLTVALGPDGANSKGALSDLLEVTAKNFGGQGAQFHQTIKDFSKLSGTLDANKEELFGSARALEGFIGTLAKNDTTVRRFNQSLSRGSNLLAGERQELSATLKNLSTALGQVATFVQDNRDVLGKNIKGLNRVAKVFVKRRAEFEETLTTAPLALNNLFLTYNPDAGTLDTNANIGQLVNQIGTNPSLVLCTIANQADGSGQLCDALQAATGPLTAAQGPGRTGTFGAGAGTGSSSGQKFDPTLGGLVEVGK